MVEILVTCVDHDGVQNHDASSKLNMAGLKCSTRCIFLSYS